MLKTAAVHRHFTCNDSGQAPAVVVFFDTQAEEIASKFGGSSRSSAKMSGKR